MNGLGLFSSPIKPCFSLLAGFTDSPLSRADQAAQQPEHLPLYTDFLLLLWYHRGYHRTKKSWERVYIMNIALLSAQYEVKRISESDLPAVLALCEGNPQFYVHRPPAVSIEGIQSDLTALPPGKTPEDKYYLGFFDQTQLLAVMDLILQYPNQETAFIGFFMLDRRFQGQGLGSSILSGCFRTFKNAGFSKVRLGYAKGNSQAKAFWTSQQFLPTGEESVQEHYTSVVMEKELSPL